MIQNKNIKVTAADRPLPLIFDSPHSGRVYPDDFGYSCEFDLLSRAEDNYVDELFSNVPAHGGTLLCALFPRTYVDVNRSMDDIDPDILEEEWPHITKPTSRSHAGIGLIRRILKPGVTVYDRKLSIKEIEQRIEEYYKPYHNELERLLHDAHYSFGEAWHINCHSMPQTSPFLKGLSKYGAKPLPDFVLGDRDGTSCHHSFTFAIKEFLDNLGYSVTINDPYRGVELVDRYSNPETGRHSIQIEINKGLYWDEREQKKTSNYNTLKSDIDKLVKHCSEFVCKNLSRIAAD